MRYIYMWYSHLHALLQHTLESDLVLGLHFSSVAGSLGEDMLRPDSQENSNLGTLSVIGRRREDQPQPSALTAWYISESHGWRSLVFPGP